MQQLEVPPAAAYIRVVVRNPQTIAPAHSKSTASEAGHANRGGDSRKEEREQLSRRAEFASSERSAYSTESGKGCNRPRRCVIVRVVTESMRVPLTCAFLLGVAGGARSMLAGSRGEPGGSRWSRCARKARRCAFLEGRNLNRLLVGLALAEIVADKLPMTPSRKQPLRLRHA